MQALTQVGLVAAIAGAILLAETRRLPGPPQGSPHPLQLRIIDSSTADWCEGDGITVWRLQVISKNRRDTVRRAVQPWPVAVSDSTVHGLVANPSACQLRLFEYNAASGRFTFFRVPADAWGFFSDFSSSPDGQFLLYLAENRRGREAVAIRRWPADSLVIRGPWRGGCECDVDRHHAHWVTADSFELGTQVDQKTRRYERVSGSVSGRRVHIDTLVTAWTYWHARAP
jgi:hypothetical protein